MSEKRSPRSQGGRASTEVKFYRRQPVHNSRALAAGNRQLFAEAGASASKSNSRQHEKDSKDGSAYQRRSCEEPKAAQPQRGGRWGYKRLEILSKKNAQELLHSVANSQTGFAELMEQDLKDKPDWIALMLVISVKATRCDTIPASLNQFLNMLRTSRFLKQSLSVYLSSTSIVSNPSKQRRFCEPIKNILRLLQFLLERLPQCFAELIPVISTAKFIIPTLQDTGAVDEETTAMLEELQMVLNVVKEDSSKRVQNEKEAQGKGAKDKPPDDFRQLSVFPCYEEICRKGRPFLRKNKVHGSYENMDHYLDVHFRLLKEDLVAPLRESIAAYFDLQERDHMVQRIKDIRLYHRVSVLHPVCTNEGIGYRVQFDITNLKHIRWETSKRLLFGSLVCLSADNFDSFIFAAVVNRNRENLQKGLVDIQCTGSEDLELLQDEKYACFVMVETTTYFEAYRHVLSGLQEIQQATFPFQDHLVKCKKNQKPPQYLQQAQVPIYDFKCLLTKVTKADVLDPSCTDETAAFDYEEEFEDLEEYSTHHIPILEENQWPTKEELGLDPSQRKALQAALTKELALIQGPPGTGKTFIGLKIVKALLKNRALWMNEIFAEDGYTTKAPILVVCYTNHALDQFLEGIRVFERKGIVRVGGRSKSTLLEDVNIRAMRKYLREKKTMPKALHEARVDTVILLQKLKSDIEKDVARLDACKQGIISESMLISHIDICEHWAQLTSGSTNYGGYGNRSALVKWLQPEKAAENRELLMGFSTHLTEISEADDDLDIEDDAQKIIEQRVLEIDDEANFDDDSQVPRRLMLQSVLSEIAYVCDSSTYQAHGINLESSQECNSEIAEKLLYILNYLTPMDLEEASKVKSIWSLPLVVRWRLYKAWLALYRQEIILRLKNYAHDYQLASERLKEILFEEDLFIMSQATVVGMTTTAAARYRGQLQKLSPRIIIIEEAAEVLEAHIITTLSPGCQHLVMIGDHKQLRPNPNVYELAESYKLKISLFERLIMNGISCVTLEKQHRMRPQFAALLVSIYPDLKNAENVLKYEDVQGMGKNLYFISHEVEECIHDDSQSKINKHEAEYVAKLCRYLRLQGYKASQITILTPYTGQLFAIKEHMFKDMLFKGVRVCAVDNYQGEENDIILLSLVRSNVDRNLGFVGDEHRICVSMSRARIGLYVIGDFKKFAEKSMLWSKIITLVQKEGCYGDALPLYCRNHPESAIMAVIGKDFDKAPEGGCLRPCNTRLHCGHVCERICHSYDREHKDFKCLKICGKSLCAHNHICQKRCFEECGPCRKIMERELPNCGHIQRLECHIAPYQFQCKRDCRQRLPCGHMCQKKCSEPCTLRCVATVKRTLSCGHQKKMKCFEKPIQSMCEEPCAHMLSVCDHPCPGTCGTCHQGRLHIPCSADCGRNLVCGHACSAPCTRDCPPCSKPCENQCLHSRCQKTCGQLCTPCKEPCYWRCQHLFCTRLCSEPCNRERCNEVCLELLPCGHECIGMCGEPCPKKCRICNKEEVEDILFGTEEEPDARFVELQDCGHVIEVVSLDAWMDAAVDATEGSVQIKLKECPKCKTPIRRNLRYGTLINEVLQSTEQVKEKILGATSEIESIRVPLHQKLYILCGIDTATKEFLERKIDNEDVTKEMLSCIENFINFLEIVEKLKQRVLKIKEEPGSREEKMDEKLKRKFLSSVKAMMEWTRIDRQKLSEQEEADAQDEIARLQCFTHLIELKDVKKKRDIQLTDTAQLKLNETTEMLLSGRRLTGIEKDKVKENLVSLEESIPRSGLGISDEERLQILKAIGYGKGHWYKCPKGHVYAIGDCGGATLESTCPECGSKIGGAHHQLRSDNALATEMDGATRPAWPTALDY